MKEYELLSKYLYPDSTLESTFEVMSMAIYQKQIDMIQLDVCRSKINEVFDYLELRKRYDILFNQADAKLKIGAGCFELDSYKFQTLDEVEKAIKNKAFL